MSILWNSPEHSPRTQQLHTSETFGGRGGISIPYRLQWCFLPMLFESRQTAESHCLSHWVLPKLIYILCGNQPFFLDLNLPPAGFVWLHTVLGVEGKWPLHSTTSELRDAIIPPFLLSSLNQPSLFSISSLRNCSTLLNRFYSAIICCWGFCTFSWLPVISPSWWECQMYTAFKCRCTGDLYSSIITFSVLFSILYLLIPNIRGFFFPFTEHWSDNFVKLSIIIDDLIPEW